MILYLDTSALVKLYVDEDGTLQARRGVGDAEVVSTSEIAYVELRAALARRYREGALKPAEHRRALRDLHRDWPQFFLIAVGSALVREAGRSQNITDSEPMTPSIWLRAWQSRRRRKRW